MHNSVKGGLNFNFATRIVASSYRDSRTGMSFSRNSELRDYSNQQAITARLLSFDDQYFRVELGDGNLCCLSAWPIDAEGSGTRLRY